MGRGLLVRTLETLGQAVVDMRGTDAADPRLVLEIALVRLARRDAGPPLQALAERVDRLERGLAPAGPVAALTRARGNRRRAASPAAGPGARPPPPPKASAPPARAAAAPDGPTPVPRPSPTRPSAAPRRRSR